MRTKSSKSSSFPIAARNQGFRPSRTRPTRRAFFKGVEIFVVLLDAVIGEVREIVPEVVQVVSSR